MPAAEDWIHRSRPPADHAVPVDRHLGVAAEDIGRQDFPATRFWPASTISAPGAAAAICSRWRGFVT